LGLSSNLKPTNILQTTVGYEALLNILVDILEVGGINQFDSIDIFVPYLEKCKNIDFGNTNLYTFNNRGKKILYLTMSLAIFPSNLDNPKDDRKQELSMLLIE
jgi:hypothetical protein